MNDARGPQNHGVARPRRRARRIAATRGGIRESVRDELLAMAAEDLRVREELASDGSLFHGYHPQMAEVHSRNAARLCEILDEHGWPGRSLVGEDGEHAAWLVLQHAIGDPELQRRGLELLKPAAEAGEVPKLEVAMLEDRIRFFEGRPQLYGTHYDWDESGEMSPWPVEDPHGVDRRRAEIGLPALEESTRRHRAGLTASRERPPADWVARKREMEEWARSVGWRR